jgi:rhodanese-related sulfurtransferase
MKYNKLLLVALLVLAPVLAAATPTFSALTVREVGNFITTLPADWHGVAPAAARAQIDAIQPFILDIREVAEFREGHIAGAVNIPLRTLPANIAQLPRDRPIIVYCRIGHRGALAIPFLRGQGYNARSLMGGLNAWTAANLPVVRP